MLSQFTLLIGFFLSASLLFSQEKADFLILKNPAQTRILDRYQQSLNNAEKVLLFPNTPWQIETDSMTLSDQFTRAVKVSRNKQIYYILIDEEGKILTRHNRQDAEIFRNCILIYDTLELVTDRRVFFSTDFNSKGNVLLNGTKLIRLFEYKNKSFVKILNSPRPFGWINYQKAYFKKQQTQNVTEASQSDTSFFKQIKQHITKTNQIYVEYFSNFNDKYNQSVTIPHWQIETDKMTMTIFLQDGAIRDMLQRSTQQLTSNLQNILIGHSYRVSYQENKIFIRPK